MPKGWKAPEVMRASSTVFEKGANPSRIVLLKHFKQDGTVKEYSTHWEQFHGGRKTSFAYGNYFPIWEREPNAVLADAVKDFEARMKRHSLTEAKIVKR